MRACESRECVPPRHLLRCRVEAGLARGKQLLLLLLELLLGETAQLEARRLALALLRGLASSAGHRPAGRGDTYLLVLAVVVQDVLHVVGVLAEPKILECLDHMLRRNSLL